MRRCYVHLAIPFLLWLSPPAPTTAESLAPQSTPEISVFVYGFPGLDRWVVEGAEAEANRIFRQARIQLKWTNCLSEVAAPALCYGRQRSGELVVRFTSKAPPSVSAKALGAALFSPVGDSALVFYRRISLLPTNAPVHIMLGRVLAHEIAHLLLPNEKHSSFGLMRADWVWDDLRFVCTTCLRLEPDLIQHMQQAVRRRGLAEHDKTGK